MPAPSARSGLKEFVECPGVISTVTCWANPESASISSTMPVVKRFNRGATTLTTSDLRISCLMATELQRQEVKYFTLPRQVPCQKRGDSRPPPVPFSYCSHRQGAWDQRPYAQEGGQHHDGGSRPAARLPRSGACLKVCCLPQSQDERSRDRQQ